MLTQIELGDIVVDVELKNIKNIHLSVYPPTGRVRIAAPARMDLDTIRVYAITKLDWIKAQQQKFLNQQRETPREYLERESHYVWGRRYLLKVILKDSAPEVTLKHSQLVVQVRPGTSKGKIEDIIGEWYRGQIRKAVPPLISKWEPLMGVKVGRLFIQRMKTKWGSCNHVSGNLRLNTDLAKKPPECLEYIVVHEMAHLLESTHNSRFVSLMDRFMPRWQFYRTELNRLPVRHEHWAY